MNDIMIDLETMSLESDAAITAIGAALHLMKILHARQQ